MATPQGFKDFTAEVLTSDDVDGYLMRQSIMVFASSAARDAALGAVLREGMHAYLADTNQDTYYDGATWQLLGSAAGAGSDFAYFLGA